MKKLTVRVVLVLTIILLHPKPSSAAFPVDGTYQDVFTQSPQSFDIYDDKVVIVEAFATYCEPCKLEMYELSKVKEVFGSNITILSLSVDGSDTIDKILKFKDDAESIHDFQATWNFGHDNHHNFFESFSIGLIPSTFIFNAGGDVEKKWEGTVEANEIISYINANVTIPEEGLSKLIRQLTGNPLFKITLVSFILILLYKIAIPTKK